MQQNDDMRKLAAYAAMVAGGCVVQWAHHISDHNTDVDGLNEGVRRIDGARLGNRVDDIIGRLAGWDVDVEGGMW